MHSAKFSIFCSVILTCVLKEKIILVLPGPKKFQTTRTNVADESATRVFFLSYLVIHVTAVEVVVVLVAVAAAAVVLEVVVVVVVIVVVIIVVG